MTRPSPTWKQLCVLSRQTYDPHQTLGDWADRIKTRLAKDGFTPVPPDQITDAMAAIERATNR